MHALELLRVAIDGAGVVVFQLRMRTALAHSPETSSTEQSPDVSVIVPARNEASNLPALLVSMARLVPAPRELIVVDDHSTDRTAAVAGSLGAHVLRPRPLPKGWIGKPWACAAGAAQATSSLLLFTDADTVHAKDLLGRACAVLEAQRADLLSILPTHRIDSFWERFQGIFQLLLLVATRAGAPRTAGERCFSIGQYLLIRRAAYDRIGGHAAVRSRVAEDLAFARLIHAHGFRFALLRAPGALEVRMYPEGLVAFVRGWRRNFRDGLRAAGVFGVLETALAIVWLLDVPRWLVTVLATRDWETLPLALTALALTCLTIAHWQRQLGKFRACDTLAYPWFVLLFVWISVLSSWDSLWGRPVSWRGRQIRVEKLGCD